MARRGSDVSELYKWSLAQQTELAPIIDGKPEHSSGKGGNAFVNFNFRESPTSQNKFDPAGNEATPGEQQWRVKADTDQSKKHAKIVGVNVQSIKIYTEDGSNLLREFPLTEIAGFNTDIGLGIFAFTWKPHVGHPGEIVHLFSKKYCVSIQHVVNAKIAEILRRHNVSSPDAIITRSGLTQVQNTTTIGNVVRRLSRAGGEQAKKEHLFPTDGYYHPPASPSRKDSSAAANPPAQKPRSRKGSKAIAQAQVHAAAPSTGDGGIVSLEEDLI